MIYVLLYLLAIVIANLTAAAFGPIATIPNAFLFIGLDLTARDRLHDSWQHHHLPAKMGALIITGSALTIALNVGAWRIAAASATAFAITATVDTLTYALLHNQPPRIKVNASNTISATVDSILFPLLAFGTFMPWITLAQLAAKITGGFLWSLVIFGDRNRRRRHRQGLQNDD